MSRLIDADKLIKKFNYAKANTEEENIMCATVRRMIQEESTAFDMDDVVEQLEMLIEDKVSESGDDLYIVQCLNEAIEIVKGCGVE